jgi:hypothetical protein
MKVVQNSVVWFGKELGLEYHPGFGFRLHTIKPKGEKR